MSNTTKINENDFVTGYRASKILAEVGLSVRPQMIYNYIQKGYIPSTNGKVRVSDLAVWANKYQDKKAAAK